MWKRAAWVLATVIILLSVYLLVRWAVGRSGILHRAVAEGRVGFVNTLLALGVDPDARDGFGLAPLHGAASHARSEMVSFLIANGADVKAADRYGITPLHVAVMAGSAPSVELLLAAGSEVNARSSAVTTPLHFAAMCGDAEIVSTLLEFGADLRARTDTGKTPLIMRPDMGTLRSRGPSSGAEPIPASKAPRGSPLFKKLCR